MIYLEFTEPIDDEWNDWKQRCTIATNQILEAIENSKSYNITNLYAEQRHRFSEHPFYSKCAYCECNVDVNSPKYVEHFRPKGEVRNINNEIILKNNSTEPHSGYYWLAYKWQNLLPTCYKCNTWHTDTSGIKIGKGTRFPIANTYAEIPGDEILEDTLLIHPLIEDPKNFLYIDNLGVLHSQQGSQKGNTTISLFGLNTREVLINERKREYDNIKRRFKLICTMDNNNERSQELIDLKEILKGKNPYTIAARKAVEDSLDAIQEIKNNIIT